MIKRRKMIIFLGIVVFLCVGVFALYKYGEDFKKDNDYGNITQKDTIKNNIISTPKNEEGINESSIKSTKQAITENASKEIAKQVSAMNPVKEDNKLVEYIVKPGDTISKIHNEHIVSYTFRSAEQLIINENNLPSSEILEVGMKLKIPSSVVSGYIKHKVVKGESLNAIAKKYMGKNSLADEINLIEVLNGKENTEIIEIDQVLLVQKNN